MIPLATICLTEVERSAILLSLKVALGVSLLVVVPAIALGWALARHSFRGKLLVEGIVHAPLVVPPVVTGYLLLLAFGRNGWLGSWLHSFGIRLVFAWQGAVLASAVVAMPLAVRSIRLAISMVDPKLEEAAAVLGFSRLRTFMSVTLPLAWPGVVGGVLLAFARSLGEFGATITFAGNVEGVTQTLPLAIYSSLQVPGGEKQALFLSCFSLLLCVLSMSVSEQFVRRAKKRCGKNE